jgi:DNA repair exonuclease SbcCD ATPase subunit
MKFVALSVSNFLTISRAMVSLKDRGLHLIQGANDDDGSASSNGSGKSSLVDAICWCLFGTTARGIKGDAVVNNVAKKNTHVCLVLENAAATYTVTRCRKDRVHKNALTLSANTSTGSVEMTKGTEAETQKEVERVLGCSYDVFMAAVYSGQEVMPDLPKMTDRELKRLIEESAGLQRIEAAYGLARERMNAANTAYELTVGKVMTARKEIEKLEERRAVAHGQADGWEAGRGGRVIAAEARVICAAEALKTTAVWLRDNHEAFTKANWRIADIDEQLAQHTELRKAADLARSTFDRADRAIDRDGLRRLVEERERIQKAIDNAPEEMKKPCPECGKPHTEDELKEFREHLAAKLLGIIVKTKAKKADIERQLVVVGEAKAAMDAAALAVPNVTAINTERTGLQAVVGKYRVEQNKLETQKFQHNQAKDEVTRVKEEANPHASAVALVEDQLSMATSGLGMLMTLSDEQNRACEIATSVVKVFGPAGVRAHILDTVTPFLNSRTADYLSVLSDGNIHATWTTLTKSAAGELKEKFSIEVANDKGADSFMGLSGGEKRKVRLATALALQDLVASRATQPIDLWIGDEIDDALDPAGLERLMTILERKARERGTVLVISHSDLRDWCDEVTIVRKKGGVSEVEGSLCV